MKNVRKNHSDQNETIPVNSKAFRNSGPQSESIKSNDSIEWENGWRFYVLWRGRHYRARIPF